MSDGNRKLGALLLGVGGFSALLALVCCAAPWLIGGLLIALGLGVVFKNAVLIALGLGVVFKNAVLIALAVGGVILVLAGLALRRKHAKEKGSVG